MTDEEKIEALVDFGIAILLCFAQKVHKGSLDEQDITDAFDEAGDVVSEIEKRGLNRVFFAP